MYMSVDTHSSVILYYIMMKIIGVKTDSEVVSFQPVNCYIIFSLYCRIRNIIHK